MKQVAFSRFGEPSDVLEVEDVAAPVPRPEELVVRLTHRPVHPADLMTVRGTYGIRPPLPAVAGAEGLGIVVSGSDAPGAPPVGSRVFVIGGGTWRDYAAVPSAMAIPVPEGVSDAAAAQLVVNPVTAWLLLERSGATEGDWILQTAGRSTVARFVSRLAAERGVQVLNLVRGELSPDDRATGGMLSVDDGSWAERARAVIGETHAVAALDAVGGAPSTALLSLLREGGRLVAYGALSGEPIVVDPAALAFRDLAVEGFWLARWFQETDPPVRDTTLGQVFSKVVTGDLAAEVEAGYPLEEVRAAVEHAERPGRRGKILLTSVL